MLHTVLRFLLINDQKIPNMTVVLLVITNHSDKYMHNKSCPVIHRAFKVKQQQQEMLG